ncbi:MAG: ferrous iron transport protein A [Bacilli bacterium]
MPLGNGPVKTLKDIKIGSSGMVLDINARGPLRRRFMDMGITRGTVIQVMKYAPLGDPMELRLRDYVLSIRKSEAELIIVQEV